MELADQKEMMAMMEVWLEKMEANQEKLETKMKAYTDNMEANQEKFDVTEIEAVAEHYNRAPCVKATHLFTSLQGRVSGVLHADTKGATYGETGSLDQFGDQNLAVGYCSQRKTWTWDKQP
jgi:hypothetical protein